MTINPKYIRAICPTRIDFTGGFTDVMPIRAKQWVTHINLAINLSTSIFVKAIKDKTIQIKNKMDNCFEVFSSCENISKKRFLLVKTALQEFGINNGISITIDTQAPSGAGLGTSGALTVGLVAALTAFTGKCLPKNITKLAIIAAEIERKSGMLGGLQDQFAATLGGLNSLQFCNLRYNIKPVKLSFNQIKEIEQHILILYPGGSRQSTDIVFDVVKSYKDGDLKVKNALNSLNCLAPKIFEALQSINWKRLSILLNSVREQQLILHPNIIDSVNQKIINELRNRGVNGIKLLGGGGERACLLVICVDAKDKKIVFNISKNNNISILPVKFASKGIEVRTNYEKMY